MSRIRVIVGETGTGKSRLLKALTRRARRLVVVDTMMEHEDVASHTDLRGLYKAAQSGEPYRLGVYPQGREQLDWTADLAASRKDTALALDEYSYWFPLPQHVPSSGMLAIVRCGRKLGQELYVVSQSPCALYKHILSQCELWVFPMDELADVAYVQRRTRGEINAALIPPIADGYATCVCWANREAVTHKLRLSDCRLFRVVSEPAPEPESAPEPMPDPEPDPEPELEPGPEPDEAPE